MPPWFRPPPEPAQLPWQPPPPPFAAPGLLPQPLPFVAPAPTPVSGDQGNTRTRAAAEHQEQRRWQRCCRTGTPYPPALPLDNCAAGVPVPKVKDTACCHFHRHVQRHSSGQQTTSRGHRKTGMLRHQCNRGGAGAGFKQTRRGANVPAPLPPPPPLPLPHVPPPATRRAVRENGAHDSLSVRRVGTAPPHPCMSPARVGRETHE